MKKPIKNKIIVDTGIPGITQDLIVNLTKFVHKNSPDKRSKNPAIWDQEEIKEYIKMAMDEIMSHEKIVYAIINKVSKLACFSAAIDALDDDAKAKKFQKKAEYWEKRYQEISKKLGHPSTQLKIK
jgi:hypothetical protein